MKKFIALAIVTGSLLLMGCSKTETTEITTPKETVVEDQNVFKGTAKDLFKKGDNVICSFTFEDETTKEDGTIYIVEGKMKTTAKVLLKKENMNLEAYSVTKDGYTYTRSNMQKSQGAKFKNLDTAGNEEKYTEDPLDEKEVDFTCKEETADDSLFTIPADVSFIDITDYLKQTK